MAGKAKPMLDRFWSRVDERGPDECWEWTGGRMVRGYGVFWPIKGGADGAHRVMWQLHHRLPIPPGRVVMHSCDNPPCVNPAHLSVGTHSDNHWDAAHKGRIPGNRTTTGRPPRTLDRDQLVALRAAGLTYRAIGNALGVTAATVWRNINT